jgi:hypothetical protein
LIKKLIVQLPEITKKQTSLLQDLLTLWIFLSQKLSKVLVAFFKKIRRISGPVICAAKIWK